jgi:hypothetical protein
MINLYNGFFFPNSLKYIYFKSARFGLFLKPTGTKQKKLPTIVKYIF